MYMRRYSYVKFGTFF